MEERETIQHVSHPHSLQLQLALDEDQQKQMCSGCLEPLFGSCFSCRECQLFHLHKTCAQAPLEITNSPFHSSHKHELILGKNFKEDDDKHCDGCMLSISTSFYYCSQCEFILHKTFAELPRKQNLWFHQSLTSLVSSANIFSCDQCSRLCNGFVYMAGGYYFCLRCARISHILKCEGHEHSLFFYFNFMGECNGCGARCSYGAYRCKKCTNIALDFACITLPEATRRKCDKHFLKLAFHEKNDDPHQHYCDICEEKRDPNRWFYHCAICDNSAHSKCALGKYPFIKMKIGTTFSYAYHPHHHPLIVVKTISDTCSICDRSCWGVALKCTDSACNYIIHADHY